MRNFLPTTLVLFFITAISFAQNDTIERGSYLFIDDDVLESAIKLNLLENNKYELVYWKGDYEVKQDSLLLKGDEFIFDVDYTYDEPDNSGELKVTFTPSLYKGVYIGTQNGTGSIEYQRFTDIEYIHDKNSVYNFKIDHTQFLYLVYEGYDSSESTKALKYEIPVKATGVRIKCLYNSLYPDIKGFFDKKNKEILISGLLDEKQIATFKNEKVISNQPVKKKILPLEHKEITNWRFPENKESIVVDSVDVAAFVSPSGINPRRDFKLKVESSLAKAIKATKVSGKKFLIVYYDSNNKATESDFDTFIKNQEKLVVDSYYIDFHPQFDEYNYYLATEKDKDWLKKNKIITSPSIIILDEDGTVLATGKSNLDDKQQHFVYYDILTKRLKIASALKKFERVLTNKNANDAELIKAFKDVLVLLSHLSKVKYFNYYIDDSENYITVVDKKQVQLVWENIIKTHEKDVKPNMILVELILAETQNRGFSELIFKKDKVLNAIDFQSIDYLIKHYDAIDTERLEYNKLDGAFVNIGAVDSEISDALQGHTVIFDGHTVEKSDEKKVLEAYKKIISIGKGNFESYESYFNYLAENAANGGSGNTYLAEFNVYFNTYLKGGENPIARLDEIYISRYYSYIKWDWDMLKEYHSNLCNDVARYAVLHISDAESIKKAIKWSEYSLVVKKNDPDYLNTLAQLYYKDGQKERAIKTQQLAVELFNSNEFVNKKVMKKALETLAKMQNGTY